MDFAKLAKQIANVAALAVPVLGNIMQAEQIIEGITSKLTTAQLATLPTKTDGSFYTQADVQAEAIAAYKAWHSADPIPA